MSPIAVQQTLELALQYHQAGRLAEAEALYRQVLAAQPNHADALHYLGVIANQAGRHELAVEWIRRAIALQPNDPAAHNNLGNAHRDRGQFSEAVAAYRRALQLKPDLTEAQSNLGNALRDRGQLDEAIAAYRRAVELKPDHAEAYNNLGLALARQGHFDEAVAAHRRAIDLKPTDATFLSNLIHALHFGPVCDPRSIREEQTRWNRLHVEPLRPSWRPHGNDRDPLRRLRIGYVSPDFFSHPVPIFLAPLLKAHDHRRYEIYCYASVRRPDTVTEHLRKAVDVWRNTYVFSDAQLAECIRNDKIDILVDLAMHTAGHLLQVFARKPAPVQVSWLAYPGSTGMETIDYRLTDAHIDPAGPEDDDLGGQPVRLPDSWCCYAPIGTPPSVGPLPAGQNGTVTFGSLNQFAKIHEGLLHCWARLLGAVSGSRLLMLCPEGQARERTHAFFAAHGVARERVELVGTCLWPEYIRHFARIDIALDSFPCNGMTTTCHALWMGVPVVTRTGTTSVSRAASSLLHTVGLPEWIAQSEEDYIRIATEWAHDLPRLAELRATLRPRMQASPLMDAPRFARNIETIYRTIWQRWCAREP